MSAENPFEGHGEGQENVAPIELTPEEYKKITGNTGTEEERLKFLAERGIKPDSGPVRVFVHGREEFIQTDSQDLGTITDPPEMQKIHKKKIETPPSKN